MSAKALTLEPGWLEREFKAIDALRSAQKKIDGAAYTARINAYTQPMEIEFTVPEIRALAHLNRFI